MCSFAEPRSVQPPKRSRRGCGGAQPDSAALHVGKVGVKLNFFHVKCNLGQDRVGLGYRVRVGYRVG